MDTDRIIGQNLKRLRKHLGYTQSEAAKMLGIGRSAYANYESGESEMPYSTLERAADLFGCEEYLLFEDTDEARKGMLATAFHINGRIDGLTDADHGEIIRFMNLVKTSQRLDRIAAQRY